MKISEVITRLQEILEQEGDLEFISHDMDTDWAFKVNVEDITVYKGVCEIYLKYRYGSESHFYE